MRSKVRRITTAHNLFSLGNIFLFTWVLHWSSAVLFAQVEPAARGRSVNLQFGSTLNLANPDYGSDTLKGFGFYVTSDFARHLGIEAEFHQLDDPGGKNGIYERTFEAGPRYVWHFGRLDPYAKGMFGRGIFNFPRSPQNPSAGSVANLAYNMWAAGFGADYRVKPSVNFRVDYELQQWIGFPPNGLSPRVLGVGVAYHFH